MQFALDDSNSGATPANSVKIKKRGLDNIGFVGAAEELGMIERVSHNNNNNNNNKEGPTRKLTPGKKMTLNKPLEVLILSLRSAYAKYILL